MRTHLMYSRTEMLGLFESSIVAVAVMFAVNILDGYEMDSALASGNAVAFSHRGLSKSGRLAKLRTCL